MTAAFTDPVCPMWLDLAVSHGPASTPVRKAVVEKVNDAILERVRFL
jgi:hypothetical protein